MALATLRIVIAAVVLPPVRVTFSLRLARQDQMIEPAGLRAVTRPGP
jgi:hypothetical protein